METILLRLLLLACLSGADVLQTGKNEIKNSESCVCAVSLAEVKVKMECLQKDHEALAVKLKDLENQKTLVSVMNSQLRAQAVKLKDLEKQKTEVNMMKRQLRVKQVAFSASLFGSGRGHIGPYNTYTLLTFRHVLTNIGNAYNNHTGLFTAPVKGAYHFQFYIGGDSHASAAVLVKNDQNVFVAYERTKSGYGSSSNGASLLLNVGDIVFLRIWPETRIYDNENHLSTFSGYLLFTT